MSDPGNTYDLIIRVGGFTGHWDEQRRGFVIPVRYEDQADAERGAIQLREQIEVGIVPTQELKASADPGTAPTETGGTGAPS